MAIKALGDGGELGRFNFFQVSENQSCAAAARSVAAAVAAAVGVGVGVGVIVAFATLAS